MVKDPVEVLVLVGGVDYQKVFALILPVGDEVVHYSAFLVAHGTVSGLTIVHTVEVIGKEEIQVLESIRSLDHDLSHVGNVEHSHLGPHVHVFIDDALVLHRHAPSRKGYHLAAVLDMSVIK